MTDKILFFIGLSSGLVTSAALFALIASIGVLNRLAQMTHTACYIRWYELCFVLGCTLGNGFYIFQIPVQGAGYGVLILIGGFMGIYLGCFIGALSEVLNVFPCLFHRIRLKMGIRLFIIFMALGKSIGGILDFFVHNQ